jgi:uncharacterized protein YaeQ
MALTATVFKASLDVSDLRRHHYQRYPLTLARHPSETDERMMLRVLSFALFADDKLAFSRGISNTDEPDLWQKADSGEITRWIELGNPSNKRLKRARSLAQQIIVVSYGGRTATQWWQENASELQRMKTLSVIEIPQTQSRELAKMAQRSMTLQCTLDEDAIWFSNATQSIEIQPLIHLGNIES